MKPEQILVTVLHMGEQEVTLTDYNLREKMRSLDGDRRWSIARATQNWETPKPGETVVSSQWGAKLGRAKIFRMEKIIPKQPKMELELNLLCLGKTFHALYLDSRQG